MKNIKIFKQALIVTFIIITFLFLYKPINVYAEITATGYASMWRTSQSSWYGPWVPSKGYAYGSYSHSGGYSWQLYASGGRLNGCGASGGLGSFTMYSSGTVYYNYRVTLRYKKTIAASNYAYITAYASASMGCGTWDTTPPTGWISSNISSYDVSPTWSCQDGQSGCTDTSGSLGLSCPSGAEGIYTFGLQRVTFSDRVGNWGFASDKPRMLCDTKGPSCGSSASLSPSTVTSGSVTITTRCTDTGSGIASQGRRVVYDNGTYWVTATDKRGNTGGQYVTVNNIDKTPPDCGGVSYPTPSDGKPIRTSIPISVGCNDNNSSHLNARVKIQHLLIG